MLKNQELRFFPTQQQSTLLSVPSFVMEELRLVRVNEEMSRPVSAMSVRSTRIDTAISSARTRISPQSAKSVRMAPASAPTGRRSSKLSQQVSFLERQSSTDTLKQDSFYDMARVSNVERKSHRIQSAPTRQRLSEQNIYSSFDFLSS